MGVFYAPKRMTLIRLQYEKLLPIGLKGYSIIITTIVRSAVTVTQTRVEKP